MTHKNTVIQPLGDETRHYWLIQRMAQATHTDLTGAAEDGALSTEDWAGMVQRCRKCRWAEGCERWLDRGAEANVPPVGCLNRSRLMALKQGLEA